MNDNERRITEMYLNDTEELRNEIDKLKKERDLWENRALEAETELTTIKRRMMRHV
jgi:molecular chaperone GrpE (heat shock protein)